MTNKKTNTIAFAALVISALTLVNQFRIEDKIQSAINDNSRIEDGLYKSVSGVVATSECRMLEAKPSGNAVMYTCENDQPLGVADSIPTQKIMSAVHRNFDNSSANSLVSAGYNDGNLRLKFIRIEVQPYTWTVVNENDGWKITCMKPVNSGEVCPQA